MTTSPKFRAALVRLRVIALVYGVAWVIMPATFLALLVAKPSFALLGVDHARAGDATETVGVMLLASFALVAWVSPVFVWALASARRSGGGGGLEPLVLAVLHFVVPYFPLGLFVSDASSALVRDHPRAFVADATPTPVPWWMAWAGVLLALSSIPLLFVLKTLSVSGDIVVVALPVALVGSYALSRIVIARRIFRICRDVLASNDDVRAAHTESVAG